MTPLRSPVVPLAPSPTATPSTISSAASVFRVDKFVVPPASLRSFLAQVERTHQLIGAQRGCLRNLVLHQAGGPGEFNVVTLVEWESAAALAAARADVQAHHAREGFDAAAFMAELGIRSDLAEYALALP